MPPGYLRSDLEHRLTVLEQFRESQFRKDETVAGQLRDHEKRIRVNETFRIRVTAYVVGGSILGGAVVSLLNLLLSWASRG